MNLLKLIDDLKKTANEFLIAKDNFISRESELVAMRSDIEEKLLKYSDFKKREAEVNERFAKIMAQDAFQKANDKLTEDRNAFFYQRDKDLAEISKQKKQNEDDRLANLDRAQILATREQELEKREVDYKRQIQEELVFKMTGLRPSEVLKKETVAEAASAEKTA